MKIKRFMAPIRLKQAENDGDVVAAVSIFDTPDDMGEIVRRSFFTDGQRLLMAAWGHDWGALNPGRGEIRTTPTEAQFHGYFYQDTLSGQEHYKTVKNNGDLQEWSFGFLVEQQGPTEYQGKPYIELLKGTIFEASPVLVGAHRETYTIDIKGNKIPVGSPGTGSGGVGNKESRRRFVHTGSDEPCDKCQENIDAGWISADEEFPNDFSGYGQHPNCHCTIQYIDVRSGRTVRTKQAYGSDEQRIARIHDAYYDTIDSWWGPIIVATYTAERYLIVQNYDGAETTYDRIDYTEHPDGTFTFGEPVRVEQVYMNLTGGLSFTGQIRQARAACLKLSERTKALAAIRAKEGRAISSARRSQLEEAHADLVRAADTVRTILDETAPKSDEDAGEKAGAISDLELIRARLSLMQTGVLIP